MNKKRISLLLSLICGLSALSSCGGDGKMHIKFWHTMGQNNQDVLRRVIETFESENPNVVIEHSAQGDYTALHEKLLKAIPAATMPTMAFCYPDHVADYMSNNAVMQLDDWITGETTAFTAEEGSVDDFVETYWEEGTNYEKDGTYSVPFAKSTEVLFYNKTMFEKHNLTVPTTWEEMWALCAKIKTDVMPVEPTIEFPMGYDSDSNLFITMCEHLGISYTTNENINVPSDHITFNNADAKALVQDLVDKYKDGLFVTKGVLPNNAYTSTYFTEGKTIMSIGSTGGTSYNVSTNFEVAIAPAPITSTEGNGDKYILQGPSICFFKKGTDELKEMAWKFYKALVKAENTAAYSVRSGYEPVRKSALELPGYQEYLQGDSLQAKVSAVTATIQDQFFLSPVFYGSAAAREQVGNLFAQVAMGVKTLDKAFADAYKVAVEACGN